MALLGMPVLLLNMGGEMVYILEQRLTAQSINNDKSKRVLQDVIRTLFNAKFIEELMKPQDLYSVSSLRGIFDRLAHSSIMRLSESSMDKLFDLMTMGVKYQVVCSSYPAELVDVTLNHLDSMRVMVEGDDSLDALVVSFRDQFKKRYENLSFGDFLSLKQTLHAFFQDRRVKVSLFLQEGLQTQTGTMVFPHCEHLPPGVVTPNTVKFYIGGEVKSKGLGLLGPPCAANAKIRTATQPVRSKLGLNLYLKSKPSGQSSAGQPTRAPPVTSSTPPSSTTSPATALTPTSTPSIKATEAPDIKPTSRLGAAELNILAQLIGPPPPSPSSDPSLVHGDKEAVRVNLFAADSLGQFEVSPAASSSTEEVMMVVVVHESNAKYLEGLMDSLDIQNGSQSEGQDLLDLMDSAG